MKPEIKFTVSEFVEVCNQSLEYAFTGIIIEGEVASFKINQGKWVFFDLKDADSSVNCFMPLDYLTVPITDGMKVQIRATAKLTRWGKFSLTVRNILPLGEGNIKKSFELLKKKLTDEGLFDPSKKRPLPQDLTKVGVISSTAAAGYIDFLKILSNRWGGLQISTINTQVQGLQAAEQIIQALEKFNQQAQVEVIAILRGGGSADDLAVFNDEKLVRAIATSRIPVLTGIGHEIDESLADLAADVRASTPSNAAERLTPDRRAVALQLKSIPKRLSTRILEQVSLLRGQNQSRISDLGHELKRRFEQARERLQSQLKILNSLNPETVLRQGYAIISSKASPGNDSKAVTSFQTGDPIEITTLSQTITAEVKHVKQRPKTNF